MTGYHNFCFVVMKFPSGLHRQLWLRGQKDFMKSLKLWLISMILMHLDLITWMKRVFQRPSISYLKCYQQKGKKQLNIITSAERSQLTTVIGCCKAAGLFLPPFLFFVKMQPRLTDGALSGAQETWTSDGSLMEFTNLWNMFDLRLRKVNFTNR